MKKMFAFLFMISILCGCSKEVEPVITSSGEAVISPETTVPPTGEISEENMKQSSGTIDLDKKTFTEQLTGYLTKTEDNELKVTFDFTCHSDESNSSHLYLDSIEFSSIEIISGWDSCEFLGINSIEYSHNHQIASIFWTYQVEKDGETWTEEYDSKLALYDIQ